MKKFNELIYDSGRDLASRDTARVVIEYAKPPTREIKVTQQQSM